MTETSPTGIYNRIMLGAEILTFVQKLMRDAAGRDIA